MKRIIFDFGAHAGQDIDYYLANADTVVAVEANPKLAAIIENTHEEALQNDRLALLNKCLTVDHNAGKVPFFIHRYDSGLSRFLPPTSDSEDYEILEIEAISIDEVFKIYGMPYYLKIDLEGFDKKVIQHLLDSRIFPEYISFENPGKEMLVDFLDKSSYASFNLVSFYNFTSFYGKKRDKTAGPFGDEIKSPWLNSDNLLKVYEQMPNSWFDIHARKLPPSSDDIDIKFYQKKFDPVLLVKQIVPKKIKDRIKSIIGFKR